MGFIRHFDPFEKYFSVEAHSAVKDVMDKDLPTVHEENTLIEIVFSITVEKHPVLYVVNKKQELLGIIDQSVLMERIINL